MKPRHYVLMRFSPADMPIAARRLLQNFWSLPLLMMVASVFLLVVTLVADHAGASAWLAARGWPWALQGKTVLQVATSATTVIVTLLSLFFSITLIVLTIAASNLAVRLIERWVDNPVNRVTLSILLALLLYALLAQASVDPDGPDDLLPRLTLTVLLALMIVTFGWLGYAFHALSRLVHVDTSVASIGQDLRDAIGALIARVPATQTRPDRIDPVFLLNSRRAGYVDDIDLVSLCEWAESRDALVELPAIGVPFVAKGQAIATCTAQDADHVLQRAIHVGRFRREGAGAPFYVALLAEIAARALSPALNDIYTALACIDQLGDGLRHGFATEGYDGWFGQASARVHVPDLAPIRLLKEPLQILTTAVAPQPVASARLIRMLASLWRCSTDDHTKAWLASRAEAVLAGASARTKTQGERQVILEAFESGPAWQATAIHQ